MDEENNEGVTLLIDCLNTQDCNVLVDFNNPSDVALKSFALFLSLIERGRAYGLVLEKLKEMSEDETTKEKVKAIFNYKERIDLNLDQPAVLPRDVFRK